MSIKLWLPYAELKLSELGLYSDARFRGRSLLKLKTHYEHLEEVPSELAVSFMEDVQLASKKIREITGAARVNMAILGNAEPHVHAHLIPRYPHKEMEPNKSPWDDPRPRERLEIMTEQELLLKLKKIFSQ